MIKHDVLYYNSPEKEAEAPYINVYVRHFLDRVLPNAVKQVVLMPYDISYNDAVSYLCNRNLDKCLVGLYQRPETEAIIRNTFFKLQS